MSNFHEIQLVRSYLSRESIPWEVVLSIGSLQSNEDVNEAIESRIIEVIGSDIVEYLKGVNLLYDRKSVGLSALLGCEHGRKYLQWLNEIEKEVKTNPKIEVMVPDFDNENQVGLTIVVDDNGFVGEFLFRADRSENGLFTNPMTSSSEPMLRDIFAKFPFESLKKPEGGVFDANNLSKALNHERFLDDWKTKEMHIEIDVNLSLSDFDV